MWQEEELDWTGGVAGERVERQCEVSVLGDAISEEWRGIACEDNFFWRGHGD